MSATPHDDTSPFEILHLDDDVLAINKPSGLPTHSPNGGQTLGVVELLQRARGESLGVHQRLDAGTSGVLVFSRTPRGAQALAKQFEGRSLRKRYLALCLGVPERRRGVLRHLLKRRGGLRIATGVEEGRSGPNVAESRYEVLDALGAWARVSLEPLTGRTHQLRAQLAALGHPVLGDVDYGGGVGSGRVLLHAHQLELRLPSCGAITLTAPPPPLLAGAPSLNAILDAILTAHVPTPSTPELDTALRLLDGSLAGVPGVLFERFGAFGALHLLDERWEAAEALQLAQRLRDWSSLSGVQLKSHIAHGAKGPEKQTRPLVGAPPQQRYIAWEHGVRYLVDLSERYGSGLYLDQRANRRWVMEHASGAEVLNLFSYTCGFSVAAAVAGAARVTSVDLSRRVLKWGRENFEANGLDASKHRFFDDEAFAVLSRAARRGERYDVVICDPPSFARSGKKRFVLHRDLAKLVEGCARVCGPGARLVLCLNHRATSAGVFEGRVREGIEAAGRRVEEMEVIAPSWSPVEAGTTLKSARVRLDGVAKG